MDEAAEAGVILPNVSGTSEKKYILESTGSGACFLDHDLDGDMDLYVVNGATLATTGPANPAKDALYENLGGGQFKDVTRQAGVGDGGWGGGCAAADYDNDGDPDLYITNYGPNVLYRNEGNGTFRDVTAQAGVGDSRWSLGAAFVDIDRDGDLDLYVANYLRFDPADREMMSRKCSWKGAEVMCGPRGFPGEEDVLYRNNGNGTFSDVSAQAGIAGHSLYGMGVAAGDLDGDGDADILVGNDSQENSFFVNDGQGRFTEQAVPAGVALSGDGRQQACMGVDLGDYDGDGDEDLFVTNFSDDYHTLYRNEGQGLFTDVSLQAGLDPATRSSLGWGGGFFDYDNDGDLDLFIAGGHVYPQVDLHDRATSYRQRNLLFRNEGNGKFADVTERSGPGMALVQPSRGSAFADYDDDGDLDVVVVNENDVPALLRNDGGNAGHWLKVRLVGRRSNRDGIGARLLLEAGKRTQFREVRLNAGYGSSHDPRIHFGLGSAAQVERLEVRWPSGKVQSLPGLPADRLVTIDEERGIVNMAVLRGASRSPETRGAASTSEAGPGPAAPAVRAVPEPRGGRLTVQDLRAVDALVQDGTRRIQAGLYETGIAAYEQAFARLPSWQAAAESPDALGFGDRESYRTFLSSLYDNLGVGLMRAERLEECPAAIERALAVLPGRAKFHYNLGLCHFHGRRYPEAVAAFQAARAAGETGADLHYDLGRALAAAGRCGEAAGELRLAVERLPRPDLRGKRAEGWYHLGVCHIEENRYPEAVEAMREALALTPGHQKALYRLAFALRRSGKTAAADRADALFQARQPADETVRSWKRAGAPSPAQRLALARAYRDAALVPQALTEVGLLLAANPRDAAALTLHGELLLRMSPPLLDRAAEAFQRALQLDPSRLDALAGLGEVHRLAGRGDEAERTFRRALTLDAAHAGAEVGLARAAFAAGRTAEAVEGLRRVLGRAPDDDGALLALAGIYAAAPDGPYRQPDAALRLLDKAAPLYGEDIGSRVRALAGRGDLDAARTLIEESPFLGQAEREELARSLALD
ncbi:MAG TPA: FG-GAP-like repeat-containing protein [Thermoanaerobaculia bacterium]